MQTLYEWEFRDRQHLDEIMERNISEFQRDADDIYVRKVTNGVIEKMEVINALIQEAAPEWPLEQVARVDKNVLRVALFEMLFDESEDVPPRVSINEAIEIAKTFGSDSSPRFVNGVLGTVYRKFNEKLAPRDAR